MVCAHKTACITTGGHYPPRALLAPEKPQEEAPQEQEQAPKAPFQAPAPSHEEPEPEEDPEIIVIEDDEEEEANGGEQPSSPSQNKAADEVPPPPMGWIVKIYHKAGGDSISHHRLVGMLAAYFADWHPAVEYICWGYTHPLEDTYWKSRASIFPKDEEKGAYQLDRMYSHTGRRATMEASIEDAAFEASMGLRYLHFDSMKHDVHRYFPHAHPVLEWAMMDPVQLEPLPQVMVNLVYDMMKRKLQLEEMVKAEGKTIKRCQEMIDELRAHQGMAKIYETFEHEPRP
jgi:hypothetical protein